jgi:hypothetical protein
MKPSTVRNLILLLCIMVIILVAYSLSSQNSVPPAAYNPPQTPVATSSAE